MRVAFLTNVVSPYRAPVFQELARTRDWQLRVFVNASTEFDRQWKGDCEGVDVVRTSSISFKRKHVSFEPVRTEQTVTRHVPVGLWRDLKKFDPAVVVTHELGPRSFIGALWCRVHARPYVVWSYQSRAGGHVRGRMRRWVRDFILKRARAIVGMGTQAREVLESYGVRPDDIIDAPNATHVKLVESRLRHLRESGTVVRLRARHGHGKRVALVCGRLVPFKGVREIIELWRHLPDRIRSAWTLAFLGNGPLVDDVRRAAPSGVQWFKAVPMHEVPGWMAMADLHVFPSLADAWGLAVQEAMLAGTPTLCSVHAGCADELIEDGVNGLLFDPLGPRDQAFQALQRALTREDLPALGQAAEEWARRFTPERMADSFRLAVSRALGSPLPTMPPTVAPTIEQPENASGGTAR